MTDIKQRSQFPTVRGPSNVEKGPGGKFCVAFTDTRDATWARQLIPRLEPKWRLVPITLREYAQKVNAENALNVSEYEGQVHVSIFPQTRTVDLSPIDLAESVRSLLELVGEIQSMKPFMPELEAVCTQFVVEFFDTQAAENAARCLHCVSFEVCVTAPVAFELS